MGNKESTYYDYDRDIPQQPSLYPQQLPSYPQEPPSYPQQPPSNAGSLIDQRRRSPAHIADNFNSLDQVL